MPASRASVYFVMVDKSNYLTIRKKKMKTETLLLMVLAKGAKRIPVGVAIAFALASLQQDATANPIVIPTSAAIINGEATSSDVVWQIGSPATRGIGSAFEGNVMAVAAPMDLHGGLQGKGGGPAPGEPSGGGDPVPDVVSALPLLGSALALIAMRRKISVKR
jgi:hypothetical protein